MVNAFYEQNCAMVVGTYMMTDFHMNMIAPGIIDHKEWTPENGRNNALRINGLGAPRAFYTPVLREIKVIAFGQDVNETVVGCKFTDRICCTVSRVVVDDDEVEFEIRFLV